MIEFYCCDCRFNFHSEPDGTGYAQAVCPKCQQLCMTAEFEGKAASASPDPSKFVVVAEFYDEKSSEAFTAALDNAGIPLLIKLPEVTGDFITGGNENVCLLVPSDQVDQARQIFDRL
jgi:hypothetical protein